MVVKEPSHQVVFVSGFCSRTGADAEDVFSCLDALRKKHGGTLTPEVVVEGLRPKSAPLHGELTWEDHIAAHQHRIAEAARLMRSVILVRVEGEQAPPVRCFLRVQPEEDDQEDRHIYITPGAALEDPEYRAQLASAALGELRSWVRRHRWHVEQGLIPVSLLEAVEEAVEEE